MPAPSRPAPSRPACSRPAPSLRTLALLAVGLLASLLLLPGPVGAETPTEVAEDAAEDGVYVSSRRFDVDEAALAAAAEDARFDGLRLVVVAPIDPQPDPKAFARRVQEFTEADAALVFPPDGRLETYVIEDLSAGRIRATEAARAVADPARAVEVFADEVASERIAERPAIVGRIITALVVMVLVIGAVVALEIAVSRVRRPTPSTS